MSETPLDVERAVGLLNALADRQPRVQDNYHSGNAALLRSLAAQLPDLLASRKDAGRWRAVRKTLHACSDGPGTSPHSTYYMTSDEFVGGPFPSADDYADRLIAASAPLSTASEETSPAPCKKHPGDWADKCAQCEAVRNAHIAKYGEWSLGDTSAPDIRRAFYAITEVHAMRPAPLSTEPQ